MLAPATLYFVYRLLYYLTMSGKRETRGASGPGRRPRSQEAIVASTQNITLELAEQAKAVDRLEKLVAKRGEMLDKAIAEKERVDYKVERRTEILQEHEDMLVEAREVLAGLEAKVAEATAA